MPTYDPIGHPGLSAAAQRLDQDALESHADTAEALLGLAGTAYDSSQGTLAVVHQVNHQVELGPEGLALASSGRGARSKSYRSGENSISPLAAAIVRRLIPWEAARGVR